MWENVDKEMWIKMNKNFQIMDFKNWLNTVIVSPEYEGVSFVILICETFYD